MDLGSVGEYAKRHWWLGCVVVALTNLTFGNASIKSFLCSFNGFIPVMVRQLESPTSDNLRKATAHLFRDFARRSRRP